MGLFSRKKKPEKTVGPGGMPPGLWVAIDAPMDPNARATRDFLRNSPAIRGGPGGGQIVPADAPERRGRGRGRGMRGMAMGGRGGFGIGRGMGMGGFGMAGGMGGAHAGLGGFANGPGAGQGGFGIMGNRGDFRGSMRAGRGGGNFATQAGFAGFNIPSMNQNAGQSGGTPGPADPLAGWGQQNVMAPSAASSHQGVQGGASRQSSSRSRASSVGGRNQRRSAAPNNFDQPASIRRAHSVGSQSQRQSFAQNNASQSFASVSVRARPADNVAHDDRIPTPGTAVPGVMVLRDSSGIATHALFLTLKNPAPKMGDLAAAARKKGREMRAKIKNVTAAEIALHAIIQKRTLKEVSDGPRGMIYVLERDQHEVYGALMELGAWRGGRWELLGVGTEKDEGKLFVLKVPA